MKTSITKVIFKDYTQKQLSLFLPSLEELIEENHPIIMFKILVYAYVSCIYSSRKIEASVKKIFTLCGLRHIIGLIIILLIVLEVMD